jgi:hypothetical protein
MHLYLVRMKRRHIAALALVGWYLMVPPPSHTVSFGVDTEAPLGAWNVMKSFDKAEGCEDFRSRIQEKTKTNAVVQPSNTKQQYATAMLYSQCIASDDSRLKQLSAP